MKFNLFKTSPKQFLSRDIGIDLGTATVLVYVRGKGVVLKEPSFVAIDKSTDHITKVGREARAMLGRNPENISVIRPLRDGVINQYDITLRMIQYFIRRACGNTVIQPRVMICIPTGISEVEERAVIDAGTQAGARKTYLIEEPVAAAIGAGLDIYSPNGNMIVDIGGGTTDVAVISLGGVVVSESIKSAGDKFDEAIMRYVRRKHNVLIGERTAERVKIEVGSAVSELENPPEDFPTLGRDIVSGIPCEKYVNYKEIAHALDKSIARIESAIMETLADTPPELAADIYKTGIYLAGGGSLLRGLDRRLSSKTKLQVHVADDPLRAVARGTGTALKNFDKFAFLIR